MIPNVKKLVSNVFSFGASLRGKQPSSLVNISMFKMKSNLKHF